MRQQIDMFLSALNAFWSQVATFVPKLIAAALLLLVGWMVARLVRVAVQRFLNVVRFKTVVHHSGLEYLLANSNVNVTVIGLIGEISFWLVMLTVVVMVSNSLGLNMAAELFNRVVLYLPNVIVAIVVLVFGALTARFINGAVFAGLNNLGIKNAVFFSSGARYATYILTLFLALQQLNIGGQMLTAAFIILFGAICLALALAFGLGGREWAAGVIARAAGNGTQ